MWSVGRWSLELCVVVDNDGLLMDVVVRSLWLFWFLKCIVLNSISLALFYDLYIWYFSSHRFSWFCWFWSWFSHRCWIYRIFPSVSSTFLKTCYLIFNCVYWWFYEYSINSAPYIFNEMCIILLLLLLLLLVDVFWFIF